jgi:hypothetical protein
MAYLMDRGRVADAGPVALRIAAHANDSDREALLIFIDRALDAGQFQSARDVWDEMAARRRVPYLAATPGMVINGDFEQPILNHAFDWRMRNAGCAAIARTVGTTPALEASFSGKQPERCEFLDHFVTLEKGTQYVLRYEYRTIDLPSQTGLHWSMGPANERELPASEVWRAAECHFTAPAEVFRLVLGYQRAPGIRRIEGTLLLRQVRLEEEKGLS